MNIKKSFIRTGRLFVLIALSFFTISEIPARDNDAAQIETLKNELLSLDYNRTNAAVFELIKLKEYDLICDVFPSFGESNKQVAAKELRESGEIDLRVDRLLLSYYKSRNHWIDPNNYELATGRNFQTFKCLQYLSEKYKVPFLDYSSERSQRKMLPIVAEIIGKLEAVISPELQTTSPPLADKKSGADVNSANSENTASAQTIIPASGPITDGSPALYTKNWWLGLIAAIMIIIGLLVWLKLKKRP